jgi:hypothetical protein
VKNPLFGWFDTTQTAKLTDTIGYPDDQLGQSVSISSDGSIIAAGADGAAYIFVERPSGWINATETAELPTEPPQPSYNFGYSIGISGDGGTVVVGTNVTTSNVGAAYVFVSLNRLGHFFCEKGACWTQTQELTDPPAGASFGNSLAISSDGSTIVAGAPSNGPGAAYVFGPGLSFFPHPPPFPGL